MKYENIELSIILPCLNEEQALPHCLDKIKKIIETNKINAEIIVVDNDSTDNSNKIAKDAGVIVLSEKNRGYGSAYLKGIQGSKGKYLFFADCDGSYDFDEIPRFMDHLKQGYEFVIGNRFKGKINKGAMPWARRYIGNPILSFLLRLFFKTKIYDAQCGMRAITREALQKLKLKTTGMEFASEMVIMAGKEKLKIIGLPINYHKRMGRSKLHSVSDGWRHLRFMLLYSRLYLFFLPGVFLLAIGTASFYLIYFNLLSIFNIRLYYHPLFISSLLIIIGYQLIFFAFFAKTYAITHFGNNPIFDKLYKFITIKNVSIAGFLIVISGMSIYGKIFAKWIATDFGALDEIDNSILALTLITVGIQTVFSSFMLSILGIKEK